MWDCPLEPRGCHLLGQKFCVLHSLHSPRRGLKSTRNSIKEIFLLAHIKYFHSWMNWGRTRDWTGPGGWAKVIIVSQAEQMQFHFWKVASIDADPLLLLPISYSSWYSCRQVDSLSLSGQQTNEAHAAPSWVENRVNWARFKFKTFNSKVCSTHSHTHPNSVLAATLLIKCSVQELEAS